MVKFMIVLDRDGNRFHARSPEMNLEGLGASPEEAIVSLIKTFFHHARGIVRLGPIDSRFDLARAMVELIKPELLRMKERSER